MKYAVLLLVVGALVRLSAVAAEQEYTWSRDVARIVYSKCTPCHRGGEIAPMPLTTYQEVRDVALSIKHEVEDRHMPPWPPEHGIGSFLGVRSLSADEYTTLLTWIDQGAPPGDLSQAPPPPTFPTGSQLGTPDLVLRMDSQWRIEGNNKDVYRFFVLPTGLLQDRDIAAIEFRPGNASVVHHVLYFVDTTGTARQRDAQDPLPGYAGFGDPGFTSVTSLLGWVPGAQQRFYPPMMGARLYKGSDLVIQVHYAPSPVEQFDQSSVNIFFQRSSDVRLINESSISPRQLPNGVSFAIPANTIREFKGTLPVPIDVSLIGVAPHMHLLGKSAHAYAVTPTSDTIQLIKIRSWDFHWQGGYAFANPVKVPRGSTLHYSASFDNTPNNKNNPNTPPKLVRWGEGTTDEMFLCYFHWLPYRVGDESIDMNTPLPTSVHDDATDAKSLSMYPSPVRDRMICTLAAQGAGTVTLEIVDARGTVVDVPLQGRTVDAGLTVEQINMQHLPAGAYVLRVRGSINASAPFVIQR